ncbi:MAG: imidazoleglycerol-phosphate dehydratase HisB [Planctomycetes bacterium]|nr:imidazoleglycerol-phosphate dehydratase HisB [Planctomycetota bacterium]
MSRRVALERKTKETHVEVALDLDGQGAFDGGTGLGFLDHMLSAFARHGHLDLTVRCQGDLHVDEHHSVEDVALTLGQAVAQATGDRAGLARFGHSYVPMDEALVRAVLDLSGRPWLVWRVPRLRERVGDLPVELAEHFWHSFAQAGLLTLHVECLYGTNQHHVLEACWKAAGRALAEAVGPSRSGGVLSTKGSLRG